MNMLKTKFSFKTKAQNLLQLKDEIKHAKICEVLIITVNQWEFNKQKCLNLIKSTFKRELIVVRSSAKNEDTLNSSMAGAYDSILNINVNNDEDVVRAINNVIKSYKNRNNFNVSEFEILIQPMLQEVSMSGVVFTKDNETGSPYFMINYDEVSKKTDTVTSGYGHTENIIRIYKQAQEEDIPLKFRKIINMIKELEYLTNYDNLDIEFAIRNNEIYLLQIRPLIVTNNNNNICDTYVDEQIKSIQSFIKGRNQEHFNLYGNTTAFSDMTDWNPAEIIGTKPKPLSSSLYTYIIMKNTWREARRMIGYNDPSPHHLMVKLGGHPYVDIRNDFNSFLPAGLSKDLSHKLINYYLDRLREHPEFHDKVEFEILCTCLAFDFDTHKKRLLENGFSLSEVEEFRIALLDLTNNIIHDTNNNINNMEHRINQLIKRREELFKNYTPSSILSTIENLLEDCIHFGTIPFSLIVRGSFIGSALLKSLKNSKIISEDEYDSYLNSIYTISSEFTDDLNLCKENKIKINEFLEKYGHLRPGTYDITIPTYEDNPSLYLNFESDTRDSNHIKNNKNEFSFKKETLHEIESKLKEFGFTFNSEQLLFFIRDTFVKRELYKFEFTKNLSLVLKLLSELGKDIGFTDEELSYINIEDIIRYSNQSFTYFDIKYLKEISMKNKKKYELDSLLYLPDVILTEKDVEVISVQSRKPNFITSRKIVTQSYVVKNINKSLESENFEGKVVLIENADPGYEWIFSKKIGGLVTKYGGAASHMAIRCAEYGIPAAIGCGENIYNSLLNSKILMLNCGEKKVIKLK